MMNHFKPAALAALSALIADSAFAQSEGGRGDNRNRNDGNDASDANDVIVLEFWDGDYADVDLILDESVTYEFQSLDYDTCTSSYFRYQAMSDSGLYEFEG